MKTMVVAFALTLAGCAMFSTPALAGWNSWDWANFFRAITPPPAPVVIQQPPTVIVVPSQTPPTQPPATNGWRKDETGEWRIDTTPPNPNGCEVKPYVQYKDEQTVYGNAALTAQACQINSKMRGGDQNGSSWQTCSRELSKIVLVRQAADANALAPSDDDCFALRWGVTVGMNSEQVQNLLQNGGATKRWTKMLEIAGKTTDQWRYDDFSIYFENGVVSAVQQY